MRSHFGQASGTFYGSAYLTVNWNYGDSGDLAKNRTTKSTESRTGSDNFNGPVIAHRVVRLTLDYFES